MNRNWQGNNVIPDITNIVLDSYNCAFHRTAGVMMFNSKRINPGAATTSTNIFQITGFAEIKAIYGEFTDVTNVAAGPTACSWELWDGAVAVPISQAAPGANCTGASLGSIITKDQLVANPATFLNASQCRVDEPGVGPGGSRPFVNFAVLQKYGVNTYIRFKCTTAAATDFTINFVIIWACRYPGTSVVAV